MRQIGLLAGVAVAVLGAGLSCVSSGSATHGEAMVARALAEPGARVIEGVPFFPDTGYQCGPATLAAVLGYHGIPVDKATVAKAVYSESARGSLVFDMVWYAEQQGLQARSFEATVEDLKGFVDAGNPAIVMVDLGVWKASVNHFMVVLGYTRDGVIVHSADQAYLFIPYTRFETIWQKRTRTTILITRPPATP